jgi:hypothetical protein
MMVYLQYRSLPTKVWNKDSVLTFDVPITEQPLFIMFTSISVIEANIRIRIFGFSFVKLLL